MRMLQLFFFVFLSGFLFSYPSILRGNLDVVSAAFKFKLPNRTTRFNVRKKVTKLWVQFVDMFEYVVTSDFRVCMFWLQGFALWLLGCYSLVLGATVSYTVLGYLSLLFCGLALYITSLKIKAL